MSPPGRPQGESPGAQRDAGRSNDASTLAGRLARLGLRTDWDCALHLPLRYEDETAVVPVAALVPGATAQVEGEIVAREVVRRARRQLVATLRDASGELTLRWLHFYPSQLEQAAVGRRVRAYGPVRGGLLGPEIVHPRLRAAGAASPLPQQLTPVYPAGAGVTQAALRRRIERALRAVQPIERVPADALARLRLPALAEALRLVHAPPPAGSDPERAFEASAPARRRVALDELIAQQVALREARALRASQQAPVLAGPFEATPAPAGRAAGPARFGAASDAGGHVAHEDGLVARLLAALPFALTGAQQRVWGEVERDLARAVPMHRLVQGDVGSGKTVIAALAAARAIEAGCQAALMAPTEILAEQHFGRIAQWLAPLGVRIVWLTGRLKPADKRAAQAAARDGEAQLVIGTHALIQERVAFARLGLAIVDEQHRFGVAQRLRLRGGDGAAHAPHLLMLSATPIPRTLAMSYLADLDVSAIDELPPGRQPVTTKLVSTARREEVLERIRAEVAAGRQAYWVCPLVDESDDDATAELTAATTMFEATRAALPELRVGLLHGQLPGAEKAAVMQAFAAGAIDVLVATTVIEVGVDVPNASVMVVEHAQRFGLAQLHQLRGRIGRGAARSVCVLLFDEPLGATARERLKVLYETQDGFEIARRDLQLRGPGEFLGARQSGLPLLRVADLERDADLVETARDLAARWVGGTPADAAAARETAQRWFAGRAGYLEA